jgi:hypothetical protein
MWRKQLGTEFLEETFTFCSRIIEVQKWVQKKQQTNKKLA